MILWGMDGTLKGNETRLMFRPPFVRQDDKIIVIRSTSDSSGDSSFDDANDALDCGTKFDLASEVLMSRGLFVAVVGPRARHKLTDITGWTEIQDGFLIKPMSVEEYSDLRSRFPNPNTVR